MKRALKLPKPKNAEGWILLLGGVAVAGYLAKKLIFDKTAHANFANSMNSIYPDPNVDAGDSMNSFVPTARQKHSMVIDPFHHHHHSHHGGHHHHGHGHHGRSFPDYTDRANALPPWYLDHNVPFDSFNVDANLSNIADRGIYIQTYTGNSVGSP